MTAEGGAYHEATKYARRHALPVTWWVEDNGKSVCTDTEKVWWGEAEKFAETEIRYSYDMTWPHVGTGKWVRF